MITQTETTPAAQQGDALPPSVARARLALKSYSILLHRRGATVNEISQACGLGAETLRMWRREEGLMQVRAPLGHSRLEAYLPDLKQSWDRGELLRDIAARYGTTMARISTFAKRMGWPRRSPRTGTGPRRKFLDGCVAQVKPLWDQGLPLSEIGERFGVTDTAIRALAKRMGWPQRVPPEKSQERDDLIFQALQQGLSLMGVARYTGIPKRTVALAARRHGWRPRPGASDELAGAPTRQELAVRQRRPGPLLMPRLPPPAGLPDKVAAARRTLKEFALGLNQDGMPILRVAELCGIDPETVTRWRREAGLTVVAAEKGHTWFEIHAKELERAWLRDEDESLSSIARRYGINYSQLSEFAHQQGWPRRICGRKKDSPPPRYGVADHRDRIRELWDAGVPATEIGKEVGFSSHTINRLARSEHFPHRPNQRERYEELVFQCLQDGMSQRSTAMVLGVTRTFVRTLVMDRGWRFPM